MRVNLQPAFILHRRAYRDTSYLLEIFTEEYGRTALVAKGAAGPKSRKRGLLQPFQPLMMSWSGRGELGTLTGAEENGPAVGLDGRSSLSGFYLNELLIRLLHRDDPHPELFSPYYQALSALALGGHEEPALRVFEKELLRAAGYALQLDHDTEGEPICAASQYRYQSDLGPVLNGVKEGVAVQGASLIAYSQNEFSDPLVLRECKRLNRTLIDQLLEGRPLKTRELMLATRSRIIRPRPQQAS